MHADEETAVAERFAAFRAATTPTMTGPGGPDARAAVSRSRHRGVIAVLGVLVLCLVGALAWTVPDRDDDDHLYPVAPPSAAPSASPPAGDAEPLSGSPLVDFGPLPHDVCGGPVVGFADHRAQVWRDDTVFTYSLADGGALAVGDVNGDNQDDYVARVSCLGEGAGTAVPHYVLLLTAQRIPLTAAAVLPGAADDVVSVEIRLDGLIQVRRTGGTQSYRWQGGKLVPAG